MSWGSFFTIGTTMQGRKPTEVSPVRLVRMELTEVDTSEHLNQEVSTELGICTESEDALISEGE